MAIPGKRTSSTAEMPPSASPSKSAYAGAVTADHSFLKTVTNAQTNPPMVPIHSQGTAATADCCIARCHVHAADAIAQRRRSPVLLTVPWTVIPSPSCRAKPPKAFSPSTGFEVLISCATLHSPYRNHFVYPFYGKHAKDRV